LFCEITIAVIGVNKGEQVLFCEITIAVIGVNKEVKGCEARPTGRPRWVRTAYRQLS
jgi:hypothetical protein